MSFPLEPWVDVSTFHGVSDASQVKAQEHTRARALHRSTSRAQSVQKMPDNARGGVDMPRKPRHALSRVQVRCLYDVSRYISYNPRTMLKGTRLSTHEVKNIVSPWTAQDNMRSSQMLADNEQRRLLFRATNRLRPAGCCGTAECTHTAAAALPTDNVAVDAKLAAGRTFVHSKRFRPYVAVVSTLLCFG